MCNVAARLDDSGIGKQDRVLLILDDTPAFPAVFLGAMRIGAIPVPVNILARPADFGYFLDDSHHIFRRLAGARLFTGLGNRRNDCSDVLVRFKDIFLYLFLHSLACRHPKTAI